MHAAVAFANALADATRLRIVCLLLERTLCVCELAAVMKIPQSTLSSHLRVIQRAGLLDCTRRGKWLFYRVKAPIRPLIRSLCRRFDATPSSDRRLARDKALAERCEDARCSDCRPPASTNRPTRRLNPNPSRHHA